MSDTDDLAAVEAWRIVWLWMAQSGGQQLPST
jgi:hypothetical protein